MWKKCYFCKKPVRTIGSIFKPQAVSCRKKKNNNLKFKRSPTIANHRRFSNDTIPTRAICKKCKPKDKTQKPLQYLVKALSNTIREGYDIENDTGFCPDDDFDIKEDDVKESQYLTEAEETVLFDDENAYALMTHKETVFWGGAVHTLDNIAVQQGILKEFFDSVPENIPELLQGIFENGPEQPALRQRVRRVRAENIPDLLADQQRLLPRVDENGLEPIAGQQRCLQQANVPQDLIVQQQLEAHEHRQQEQNVEIQLLPEGSNNVVEHLVVQQRSSDNDDDESALNASLQTPKDNDVNIVLHNRLSSEDADNESKLDLGSRVDNGKLSHTFSGNQKVLQDENSMNDKLIDPQSFLQENKDHVQKNYDIQEPIINQSSDFQKDDSDMLDLLTEWEGFSLDESDVREPRSNKPKGNNNVIYQDLLQENNESPLYAASKNKSAGTSDHQQIRIDRQKQKIALKQNLHVKQVSVIYNNQLALRQELLKKGRNKIKKMHQKKIITSD